MHELELARHICLLLLAVVCVYTDLSRGKLYNAVTLGALAVGLALAYLVDAVSPGAAAGAWWAAYPHVRAAVLAAALGGGLMFVVYRLGGFGAGEVKLMAAVGALAPFGPHEPAWIFVLYALVYTALVGAALGIALLIWQKRLWQGLKESARAFVRFRARPAESGAAAPLTLPYGVAIGIGVVWAWMEIVL